jgi:hypothetical protein
MASVAAFLIVMVVWGFIPPPARVAQAMAGIVQVAPFAGFFQRFEELIASSTQMTLYFIHSAAGAGITPRRFRPFSPGRIRGWRSSCRTSRTTS